MSWCDLPEEIKNIIISEMSPAEQMVMALTCKEMLNGYYATSGVRIELMQRARDIAMRMAISDLGVVANYEWLAEKNRMSEQEIFSSGLLYDKIRKISHNNGQFAKLIYYVLISADAVERQICVNHAFVWIAKKLRVIQTRRLAAAFEVYGLGNPSPAVINSSYYTQDTCIIS
ncbi:F-box protein [Aliidongia dinghuensis]|uniref:F-box protein n=1 Tax=Aliidongia dinghuensis TaxID=1867774 RepID=UPI001666814D|nr:F-box protein [Aliidongia dinghuensis]